jgi:hypothetical protein
MTKDTDRPLLLLNGSPLKEGDQDLLMRHAIVAALLNPNAGEGANGEEKAARYKLALAVYDGGEQDFTADQLVLIKRLVGMTYGPLVVGQVYDWCDSDRPCEVGHNGRAMEPSVAGAG